MEPLVIEDRNSGYVPLVIRTSVCLWVAMVVVISAAALATR
jgi:hypothetical protein